MSARAYHTVEARVAPPSVRMTPGVLATLIATCAVFLLLAIANAAGWLSTADADDAFGFLPGTWLSGLRLWQPLTYVLLHGGFFHLGFNMLTLFFFGPGVEERVGTKRFFLIYAAAAVVGAMACWAVAAATGTTDFIVLVGASGSICALLALWALWWPNAVVLLWGIVPVKMKWLVLGFLVFSAYAAIATNRAGSIAHEGHLGGALVGLGYWWWDRRTGGARPSRGGRPKLRLIKGTKVQEDRFREIVRDL